MPKSATDTAAPPPLRALGGWPGAEWFCPTVLSDADVVGFTLPKLAGLRKQNFRLVERSTAPPRGSKANGAARGDKTETAAPAQRKQASLPRLLDAIGATRAAAFRRSTFLFESAPVLYFAEIPLASLKIRAADDFRRALIGGAWRGCILRVESRAVLAMFWPEADRDITAFVVGAAPPYALHAQFDHPAASAQDHPRRTRSTPRGEEPPLPPGERERLLRELADLRNRIAELQQSQTALGAMEALGLDDARLKSMLRLLHPDRHGGSEAANEAAKWVNNLRDLLKSARP